MKNKIKMVLSPELIDAYKEILNNPSVHGFDFKPIMECFEKSETVTAKHILAEQFTEYIKKPLPKVICYIIMDQVFGFCDGKDEQGRAGYHLRLAIK